jgi:quinol monooxygenase YgiN
MFITITTTTPKAIDIAEAQVALSPLVAKRLAIEGCTSCVVLGNSEEKHHPIIIVERWEDKDEEDTEETKKDDEVMPTESVVANFFPSSMPPPVLGNTVTSVFTGIDALPMIAYFEGAISIAHFIAKADKGAALETTLRALVPVSRNDAGCERYDLFRSVEKKNNQYYHFVFIEQWATTADFDSHFNTPHLRHLLAEVVPQLVDTLSVHQYHLPVQQ